MEAPKRRQQIVEIAAEAFSRQGFRGTSTREIARLAGISEATIFKYFPRKTDLHRAILENEMRFLSDSFPETWPEELVAVRAALEEIGRRKLEQIVARPRLIRLLMFSALDNRELAEIFLQTYVARFSGHFRSLFESLAARGITRSNDPDMLFLLMFGPFFFLDCRVNLLGFPFPGLERREAMVGRMLDLFLNGILERSDP